MTTAVSDTTPVPLAVGERTWVRPLKALISYAVLFLLTLMFIYPFMLAISTSFKTCKLRVIFATGCKENN